MQTLIKKTEFDDGKQETDIIDRIKTAVCIAIRRPQAAKLQAITDYFNRFDNATVDRFLEKLASSVWVRNPNFNIELVVRKDLVNTLLGGTSETSTSKYYKVQTLTLEKLK